MPHRSKSASRFVQHIGNLALGFGFRQEAPQVFGIAKFQEPVRIMQQVFRHLLVAGIRFVLGQRHPVQFVHHGGLIHRRHGVNTKLHRGGKLRHHGRPLRQHVGRFKHVFLDTIQQQVQHLGGPGGVIRQRGVERAILINGLTILKPIDANHVGLFGILLQGFIQKVIRHARLRSFVARQSNRRGRVAQPSGHEKVGATCRLGNGLALVVLHPVGQRQHGLRVASACEMG